LWPKNGLANGSHLILQKWEYAIATISEDVKKLNELGEQGWELVAVVSHSAYAQTIFYFKRLKG
jgi:hypothetical protein